MAILHNPKIVTDGLVLHLDAGNPKSYSPNVHPYPTDITSWVTGGYQMSGTRDTTTTSPVGSTPSKWVSTAAGYIASYATLGWTLAPTAQGETWTVSLWVKSSTPITVTIFTFEANSAGNYTTYGTGGTAVSTAWQRISYTYTMSRADTVGIQTRIDVSAAATIWIDGYQVEKAATATTFNPKVNTNGANIWDLSGNNFHHTVTGRPTYSENIPKLGFTESVYLTRPTSMSTSPSQTVVLFYSTSDGQELWVRGNYNNSIYLSASASNNYYHGSAGTPTNYVDLNLTVRPDSPINYRNGNFHMWEAKNVNFSSWTAYEWFGYTGSWQLVGNVSQILVYDRILTAYESLQNYNALRRRYGL